MMMLTNCLNSSINSLRAVLQSSETVLRYPDELYRVIRSASSWDEIMTWCADRGMSVERLKHGVMAVDRKHNQFVNFENSGHYLPFLIERLGPIPPTIPEFTLR